jgi:glutamine amidotransferase
VTITVFDYGAGNLHSLVKALAGAGHDVRVEPDLARALYTDVLVLPGVGAYPAAAARLTAARASLRDALLDGLPCLGICLGMQLLYERSDEGEGEGVGLLAGAVTRLRAACVPHMGWNSLDESSDVLLARAGLRTAYFAHSFACRPADESVVTAWSSHESDRFPAVVRAGKTVGVQFHPEKSSARGVLFLRQFLTDALTP